MMLKKIAAVVMMAGALAAGAQMSTTKLTQETGKNGKTLPSPRYLTSATVGKAHVEIDYGAPSVKGRKVFYDLVPMDKIWRLGANEATGLKTDTDLMIGSLHVPAGSYTLFAMPTSRGWELVVNKQTGQWGLTYDEKQDLGRTRLVEGKLMDSQELFSITVEQISGNHGKIHFRWADKDLTVPVMAH